MYFHDFRITLCTAFVLTPVIFFGIFVGFAQVRTSSNYKIESDSINFAGGLATSTNYALESTAGELGTGDLNSTNYNLRAGYQQMVTRFISMTTPVSVIMSPSIVGITGGESNGSTTVAVTTDGAAGYELTIASSQSPSLVSGVNTIADYAPGTDPDYTLTTLSDDAHLGYSPSGVDVVQRFKDDGASLCNTGSLETTLACWDGLSTTPEIISRSTSANTPNGATTTLFFKVGIGSGVNQPAGIYTATTTLTAVSL